MRHIVWVRHCSDEFMKHVFPMLDKPTRPAAARCRDQELYVSRLLYCDDEDEYDG